MRFTPEFLRILDHERVPMTEPERVLADRERSRWNANLYSFYLKRPEDVSTPATSYEAFLEVFEDNFRPTYRKFDLLLFITEAMLTPNLTQFL